MTARRRLLTPQQCRRARHLLKWNVQDVASRCRIDARRLENYERSGERLSYPEADLLGRVFVEHGIVFGDNYDVQLVDGSGGAEALSAPVSEGLYSVRQSSSFRSPERLSQRTNYSKQIAPNDPRHKGKPHIAPPYAP